MIMPPVHCCMWIGLSLVLTPSGMPVHQVIFIFLAIGVVLIPIGVVCLVFGLQVCEGPSTNVAVGKGQRCLQQGPCTWPRLVA